MAVLGVWQIFRYGHVLYRVAEAVKWAAPELGKPLFDCTICMVPWYGGLIYLFTWGPDLEIFVTIIAAMGINSLVGHIIEAVQTINMILEHELSKGNSNAE